MMFKRAISIMLLLLIVGLVNAQGREVLTADNGSDVTQLMRLGRGTTEAVAYSPDGSTIAIGTSIGVWLYAADDLATETEPTFLPMTAGVSSMGYSADGSRLAAADEDYNITVWDTSDMDVDEVIDADYFVYALAFSPDGEQIAAASSDGSIRLFDARSGAMSKELEGHTTTAYSVAYSPDGSIIASGSGDNSVRLWDADKGTEIVNLSGHSGYVYGLAFNTDGSQLVSVSGDDHIIIWDVDGEEALVTIEEFTDDEGEALSYTQDMNAVAFAPDGATFATGGDDDFVRIFDVEGELLAIINTGADVEGLAYSPDSSQIATVGYNVSAALWDAEEGEQIAAAVGHTDSMIAVNFSPDGSTLLLGDNDYNVWAWSTADMPEITQIPTIADTLSFSANDETGLTYSPDGSYIVLLDGFNAQIWEPDLSEMRYELSGDGLSGSVAISPDSKLIVHVGSAGVFLFDAENGALLAQLTDHADWVTTVAFSPDGTLFATGAGDGTVRVYGLQ